MSNHETTSNGESMKAIVHLLQGETLKEVRREYSNLFKLQSEVKKDIDDLRSSDLKAVRRVLGEILNDESRIKALPFLNIMMAEEKPQHKQMPLLIAGLRARIPVWLYGDSGSGKTTSAANAAKMLGLKFRFTSVCPSTTKSEFLGYRDANGNYRGTAFREIYEQGGVFLIDEIDNGNPSTLAVLNAALANDYCAFPDGNIKRHQQAIFVAAANTIGRGADVHYVGRNALDATTLDRFVFVRMDIDEALEETIVKGNGKTMEQTALNTGGQVSLDRWCETVKGVRSIVHELGINHIVSPRATFYGKRLIELGVGYAHLMDMCIWKGLRETDKKKIMPRL